MFGQASAGLNVALQTGGVENLNIPPAVHRHTLAVKHLEKTVKVYNSKNVGPSIKRSLV